MTPAPTDRNQTSDPSDREQVVLLDDDGHAIGTADKAEVHGPDTPLHLAFSCYVFDSARRLLLTQRAHHKLTWPGVWSNSACGHPAPGEDLTEAVRRRTRQELGLELVDLRVVLPRFRYRVAMTDGTVENELCPVFVATAGSSVAADPEEVAAHEWVDWLSFRADVLAGHREVSPWCLLQLQELPQAPYDVWDADPAELPLPARPSSAG
jgi:isopentenyl-diphosphate delta-isomerase